jgi:site-specific recombinase XerD
MTRTRHSGSLRLRRRVWWARYYHQGELIERSTKQTDESKARRVLRDFLRTADTPAFIPPTADQVRFETLCALLRRDYRRKGNRSRIEYKLAHLAEAFAGTPALKITTEAVETYADARLAAGAARATVNRELAALRRMFRLAVRQGLVPTMPHISTPAEDNVREGFLDPPDVLALLDALRADDPLGADAVEFAYRTALRRGNVLGALWSWFALEVEHRRVVGGGLRLPGTATKNKAALTLPLTGALLALVDRRWQARVATCPYVFQADGVRLTRFDETWRSAATAIGRPTLLFHDLRRSAARALRRAGVDEQTIMRLGGWKTRSMFTRYAIVDEQDLADAQATLERVLTTRTARTVVPLRSPPRRRH